MRARGRLREGQRLGWAGLLGWAAQGWGPALLAFGDGSIQGCVRGLLALVFSARAWRLAACGRPVLLACRLLGHAA